jgi:Sulfotransferase family
MTGHLIHIGFAKAGSTSLRSWFAQHPQLAYAPGGVAGFRDVYSMVHASASPGPQPHYRVTSAEALATPLADFGQDSLDYEAIRRNPMPDAQARACGLLAHLFPTAHILIVTRGFRSMMLSTYSQYLRTGGLDSLATLCTLVALAGAANQAPWDYDYVIGLYRRAFGEGKVMVLPYELLRDDAAAFLGEIARWLGLTDIGVPPGRLNPSLGPTELAWYPLIGRRIRALPLGERGRRKAWQLYVRAVLKNRLQGPIALLQRVRPMPPVNGDVLTPELIEGFRGFAAGLRNEPVYRAYARDYLFD